MRISDWSSDVCSSDLGYAIDICEEVKKAYRARHPEREIAEDYVLVTTADRQEKLLSGEIDTVCGHFSITESRMADFDFSFVSFVSCGSVAARRPSIVITEAPQEMQGELQRVAEVSEQTPLVSTEARSVGQGSVRKSSYVAAWSAENKNRTST